MANLFSVMRFRHPHAGAGIAGFDEARVAANRFNLSVINRVAVIEMQRWGNGDAQGGHREIAVVFVEGQRGPHRLDPVQVPEHLDEDMPQQAIVAAFRKYKR